MTVQIEFLPGPLTSDMSRTSADNALRQHPAIRNGAAYALEQLEGRWVAAVVHEAAPPPFPPTGGGPDEEEAAPAPKSEGVPGGDESPGDGDDGGDEGPPSPDDGGESKPPHEHGDKGKGGLEHQIMDLLTQIATALGLPPGLGDSAVPGLEDAGGPPAGGPPGLGGPPGAGGPPHQPGDASTQHVVHERVTKPGETPPGGTPIGAPAFASVREDHPWGHLAGKVASFEVSDKIGETSLTDVQNELKVLASEVGYRVTRFREDRDIEGDRVAVAVITRH